MLFHSSIRKELARSFGATLVVLITVVMTMTLIRTLGEAGRGVFNPSDVMIIMGYTVLSEMPIILSFCLLMAVLSVLTRMFRDSEMVIWFGSGRGLTSLIKPLFRFAWPILLVIAALAFLILPWAFVVGVGAITGRAIGRLEIGGAGAALEGERQTALGDRDHGDARP